MLPRFCIIAILLLFSLARADYHYASHTGSNTYPYTSWETAADSIQAAVNAALPGDTVYVGSGEYYERVLIDTDLLALIGVGWDSTLVWWDARQATIGIVSNRYYSEYFEGLHLQNRANYWCLADCVRNNIHVNRCRFSNPQNPLHGPGIGLSIAPDSTIIENCLFEFMDEGYDEEITGYRTIIRNCLFWHVVTAINTFAYPRYERIENCIFSAGYWNMAIFGGADSLIAINNVIYGFQAPFSTGTGAYRYFSNQTIDCALMQYWAFDDYGHHTIMLNNSISNKEYAKFVDYENFPNDTVRLEYNHLWNIDSTFNWVNPLAQYDTTIGNIWAYPMFVNPDSGDYRLQAYSPLIDAGDPSILDVDGTRSDIGFFGGPGGAFYEYSDLPPHEPDSLWYRLSADSIVIGWRMNYEADFNRYIIWRDTVSAFTPWAGNIIAEPETSLFIDLNHDNFHNYYYRMAAYDNQWNLSQHSVELPVLLSGIDEQGGAEIPTLTAIESNYPNPFNSNTVIVYAVANLGPMPAQIDIEIYDILGRRIRMLLSERKEVGRYNINWNGRDDSGNALSSGIYFARISQWGLCLSGAPLKITLVK